MINAWFDGSCRPKNPGGYMAYAIVIKLDNMITKENLSPYQFSRVIPPHPSNTNNIAEYLGFKEILNTLLQSGFNCDKVVIFGDSNLVINQMFYHWKIKDGGYIEIAEICKDLLKSFSNIHGTWIPQKDNKICHELATNKLKEVWKEGR